MVGLSESKVAATRRSTSLAFRLGYNGITVQQFGHVRLKSWVSVSQVAAGTTTISQAAVTVVKVVVVLLLDQVIILLNNNPMAARVPPWR